MGTDELRTVSARLSAQTEALAALGAALRLRASGQEAPAQVQSCVDEVVAALGLEQSLAGATPEQLSAALAPIRALFLQSVDLLTDPTRAPGWTYTDVELLESLGQNSAAFAAVVRTVLAPRLEGLGESLEREDAAFLDVGVGVAALAIAMCRNFPRVRAVGIDPWELALELAGRNVAAAGLEERIELRRQRVEDLADSEAFDVAFLAGPFLDARGAEAAVERTYAALRPGGWLLFGMYRGADPLDTALARLRTARSGGAVLDPADAEKRLSAAGFAGVRTFAAELGIPSQLVVGRRPV